MQATVNGKHIFETNCFIVPTLNTVILDDLKLFLVRANTVHSEQVLFDSALREKYDTLYVIPLPDFDVDNFEVVNEMVSAYEVNFQSWVAKGYAIKRNNAE